MQETLTSKQQTTSFSLNRGDSKAKGKAMDFVNRFTGQQFRPETLLKLTDL